MPKPLAKPDTISARERLRDHQAAAAQAVAAHSTSLAALEMVISRRAKVVADQDTYVAAAEAKVAMAIGVVAHAMGVDAAADILCLTKNAVRRHSASARVPLAAPQGADPAPEVSSSPVDVSDSPRSIRTPRAEGRVDANANPHVS
jgi:hypothetical protein